MILGIESTAHTFGIGVANKGKILANVRDMFITKAGGIVPVDAAKHHREVAQQIYEKALAEAKIKENEIDAIAFSQGPGLAPCLLAGREFARVLSNKLKVPLVPVNHCIAHLEIGQSVGASDPVLLYASGANTQIIAFSEGKYRVFGETLDLGVGNFLDKIARLAGHGFPGGPEIEKAAKSGKYIELPYSVKGMDVSFSGMYTKISQMLNKGISFNDISFSVQETAFAMLVEAAERAMAHTEKKELVLGGGVACNSRLQEMCKLMCAARKSKYFCPERPLLVDNGAMIAYTGELMFNAGIHVSADKADIAPRERTDDVNVRWK
jgi:universal protein Kae1